MMNPVALVTYYLFRVFALSDVDQFWFNKRRLRRCMIQGPGTVILGDNTSITHCSFDRCDFIEIPLGSRLYAVMPLQECSFKNVRFERVTIIATKKDMIMLSKGIELQLGAEWEAIPGVPVPLR